MRKARSDVMVKTYRLNLDVIQSSLVNVQHNFDKINTSLMVRRKPPSDEVIQNIIAGYQQIDQYVADGVDLFKIGSSRRLLDLNHTVLFHCTGRSIEESKSQFKATKEHFYEVKNGGIGHLMDWLAMHRNDNVWKRAAGVFTHGLSHPQLFLEGNHRTGSLLMSYLLLREGHAPFVLSEQNAKHFFEPAELTKMRRKKTIDEYWHLPKQARKFAKLLKAEQNEAYLIKPKSLMHQT